MWCVVDNIGTLTSSLSPFLPLDQSFLLASRTDANQSASDARSRRRNHAKVGPFVPCHGCERIGVRCRFRPVLLSARCFPFNDAGGVFLLIRKWKIAILFARAGRLQTGHPLPLPVRLFFFFFFFLCVCVCAWWVLPASRCSES